MRDGFFKAAELQTVRRPVARVAACGKCGLYKGCHSPKMPVAGKGRRKILIVGEAPGENEDRRNLPFVGDAGDRLRRPLNRAGIDLFGDCWVTNAARCRPPLNKLPDKAVEHCRPFVLRAIEELQPRVILLLGNAALKSVVGYLWNDDLKGVERWAGWRIPNRRWDCWILPTWHPSHILRCDGKEPVKEMLLDAHVESVADFRKRPYPDGVPDLNKDVRVVTDVGEAVREIATMAAGGRVAFDLETTTLKPHGPDAQIMCCSMSDGKTSIAYPWHGEAAKATLAVLADKTIKKLGWNVRFEHEWLLYHHGVEVRGWEWDGMTSAHALDARPGVTGLEFQEFVRLGVEDHKGPIKKYMKAKGGGNAPNRIKELSVTQLLRYNALDSLVEYRIGELQMKEFGNSA